MDQAQIFSSKAVALAALLVVAGSLVGACDDDQSATAPDASGSDAASDATDDGAADDQPDTIVDDLDAAADGDGDSAASDGEADTGPILGAVEGFGAVTQGADSSPTGATECRVTSLADDGSPGTLRDCLSESDRYVAFDVGGTIVLQDDLNIRWSYVTVDGLTAPSPGITIEQPGTIGTTVEARPSTGRAHDIVIRYLRMDGMADEHENRGDIWGLDGQSADVYNIVLDHITARAATDGVFDIWGSVRDVTISWSLMTDTVTMLHFSTPETTQIRERISVHHNVFARNNERQIRFRHNNQLVDYANNVIYGWGWFEGGGHGLRIVHDPGEVNTSMNVVANLFHFVPGLPGDSDPNDAIQVDSGPDRGQVWFDGNIVPEGEVDTGASTADAPLAIPEFARVSIVPAAELHELVVPFVGTHFPTPAEQALLDEIVTALR